MQCIVGKVVWRWNMRLKTWIKRKSGEWENEEMKKIVNFGDRVVLKCKIIAICVML